MITLDLDRAVVTSSADPGTFYYAPKAPSIALDANGNRQLNLLSAGPVSFLQVTGAWGLDSAGLDALRHEVAGRLGRDAAGIRLQPAPASVESVSLLMGDGAGALSVLQQGKSSGVPPFHTVFNVMLDATQLARVKEALGGKPGLLALRYDIAGRRPITTIAVDSTATRELYASSSGTRSTSAAADSVRTTTTSDTTEASSRFSIELDAADWPRAL